MSKEEIKQKDKEDKAIKFYTNYIQAQEKELDWMYRQDEEYYRDEIEQKELLIKGFKTILNLIQKQEKENTVLRQGLEENTKEIEELKEDRKSYTEEYIHNNPWLYKQLNENYILRVESEQKEKQAYIDGTNAADKLCNKKWKDKLKAEIKELKEMKVDGEVFTTTVNFAIKELQSLLEKE